jgi:hypothetical protein
MTPARKGNSGLIAIGSGWRETTKNGQAKLSISYNKEVLLDYISTVEGENVRIIGLTNTYKKDGDEKSPDIKFYVSELAPLGSSEGAPVAAPRVVAARPKSAAKLPF